MTSLFRATLFLTLAVMLPLAAAAISDPNPDPNAAVILLRTSCGTTPIHNCFETLAELTTTGTTGWIWQTRNPSASAPLLVDIGPGQFGTFFCNGTGTSRGFVTLRGSGREQTILYGSAQAIKVTNCGNLSFIDLGAHSDKYGVLWQGSEGGSASWSNVDLVGLGTTSTPTAGWADDNCSGQTTRSLQYFHGSRIRAMIGAGGNPAYAWAYFTQCAESWFFGGELLLDLNTGSHSGPEQVIFNDGAYLEAFGTAIRGRISGSRTTGSLTGVYVLNGQGVTLPVAFDSHGANIDLSTNSASSQTIAVVAISAQDNVTVNSAGTAYELEPGASASATRVSVASGTPQVQAPFQWSAGTSPPLISASYASKDGEDLFVETNCNASGCSGGGNQPHLMIYSNACPTSNPWWDAALSACRH